MTWLTEIENEATLALEGNEAFTGGYMDDLRMARVIRELVAVAQLFSEGKRAAVYDAIGNLSPDAKEVINDCTAPSST